MRFMEGGIVINTCMQSCNSKVINSIFFFQNIVQINLYVKEGKIGGGGKIRTTLKKDVKYNQLP